MRRRLRQAGEAGHHGVRLIGTTALVLLLLFGAAAWRLSRGPVDLPPLAQRIGAAASRAMPGFRVTVGRATLAWEGFNRGGAPLDFRLSDIRIDGRAGVVAVAISRLRITLAPVALLHGRIAPIRVIATQPAVTIRPAAGAPAPRAALPAAPAALPAPPASLPGPPAALPTRAAQLGRMLAGMARRPQPGRLDFADFRSLTIRRARLRVGAGGPRGQFVTRDGHLRLVRGADGRIGGTAGAEFHHGAALVPLSVTIAGTNRPGRIDAVFGPVDPAAFAPADSLLAGADLPVTIDLGWSDGNAAPGHLTVHVVAGPGAVRVGGSRIRVRAADATAIADGRRLRLIRGSLALGAPGAHGQTAIATGKIALRGPLRGGFTLAFDSMTAADFHDDWPLRLLPNVRRYILKNVRAGTARDGNFEGDFDAAGPGGKLRLRDFSGHLAASGVTLSWFKHAVPMTGLGGTLVFLDKDTLAIDATAGHLGKLGLHGTMLITTLTHHDQNAKVDVSVAGNVADAFAILDGAPLHLAAHGVKFPNAAGRLGAEIDATLPLKKVLHLHDVHIAAAANLTSLKLALPIRGLVLDDGTVALSATLDHLALHGAGDLVGAGVQFAAGMALPDGSFDLTAETTAGRRLLHTLGADPTFWRHGDAPVSVHYRDRDGRGVLGLDADFAPVALALPALDWGKPAGVAGHATFELALRHGRPDGVNALDIVAPGLVLRGHRHGDALIIDNARLKDSSAAGTLTPPSRPGAPWDVVLEGPMLDLAPLLGPARHPTPERSPRAAPPGGTARLPWQVNAGFTRVRLAKTPGAVLGATSIVADGNAGAVGALTAIGALGPVHHARLSFTDTKGVAQVRLTSGDAGALFAASGATTDIAHGTLVITALRRAAITEGRAIVTDFRLRHAPVMAKVLQGLSIYGMPAATSGPGLALTRLTAPFSIAGSVVRLRNGRAFSASLGFTGTGTIDLARKTYDLSGTIVPAYALNALPGKIPVIGKLFSPEKGGGLFAARYTVAGPFADPHIMIDPLAALAPGLLRDIFGIGPPAAAH